MTTPILITNDDGYDAFGLEVLTTVVAVHEGYSPTVMAPMRDQSGKGQAISLRPFSVRPHVLARAERALVVDGTPTDCVRLALTAQLTPPPALVLSGINQGWNLGSALYSSGTVGAAREAAVHHVPAIAWSGPREASWDLLFPMIDRFFGTWIAWVLAHPGSYLSINLPQRPAAEWTWTRPMLVEPPKYRTGQSPSGDLTVEWTYDPAIAEAPADTDAAVVHRDVISVTALRPDAALPVTETAPAVTILRQQHG